MEHKTFFKKTISFGILADLQYCDAKPAYNRYFKNTPDKLMKALDQFAGRDLDFVIQLGDLIDHDRVSFEGILPMFAELKVPLYHVLGNHDYEVSERYKPKVPEIIGTKRYYDFVIGKRRFIVLDGNEISIFANSPGSENYRIAEEILNAENRSFNANFWNGAVGHQQLRWLQSVLEKAAEKHEHVFIFCHYPIFPAHRHNLLNDKEVLGVIGKYPCIKAWFNGHNHDGNYGRHHDVHFINMKGMVESETDFAFGVVTLYESTIKMEGFGIESTLKLSF